MTWHKAHSISSGLSPQLLVNSGLEKQPPRSAAPSSPSQGPPQGAPPATPVQHPPTSIEEAGRSTPQAAAGSLNDNEGDQHSYSSQPLLGANGTPANVQSRTFPPESAAQTDRPSEPVESGSDHPVPFGDHPAQSASSQPAAEGQAPSFHADSAQQGISEPQEPRATPINPDPSQNPGQFSDQNSQNPSQQPSGPPQLGRLSPPGKLSFVGMSSEPSSHKLSALEGRYATGMPVTADEAFNRALQQQHNRQGSWGSNASTSSLTGLAPSAAASAGAASGAASEPVPDTVSTSRLLATIHSGIPSTDDDGPLFAELHKLVAEEESQGGASGQGQSGDALRQDGNQEGQHDRDVDLNQVSFSNCCSCTLDWQRIHHS